MPRYYAIDESASVGSIVAVSGRSKPRNGDQVILFKKSQDDIEFVSITSVIGDSYPEQAVEGRAPTNNGEAQITLGVPQQLQGERPLSGLGGSLDRVRHFLEPEQDFAESIVSITRHDYDTILSGQIDWGRTLFRMLFHSLPIKLQAVFVSEHSAKFPAMESRRRSYRYVELARLILDFYQERFGNGLHLLRMVDGTYPAGIDGVPGMRDLYLAGQQEDGEVLLSSVGITVVEFLEESTKNRILQASEASGRTDNDNDDHGPAEDKDGFFLLARDYLPSKDDDEEEAHTWLDSIF